MVATTLDQLGRCRYNRGEFADGCNFERQIEMKEQGMWCKIKSRFKYAIPFIDTLGVASAEADWVKIASFYPA